MENGWFKEDLTAFEYEELQIKMYDFEYIPTYDELRTVYTFRDLSFFVMRRKNINHLIYFNKHNA